MKASAAGGEMTQKQKLALQIQGLEQKLIQRTNEVLKRTDLLQEFQRYKAE